jgi:hypothetical protein
MTGKKKITFYLKDMKEEQKKTLKMMKLRISKRKRKI